MSMKFKINIHSAIAVYVQIENIIRFEIAAGKMKANDQLPSVRELSDRLEVNPNTVAKSYRDLEVMGFLYTRRGMGVFIRADVRKKAQSWVKGYTAQRLIEISREYAAAGLNKEDLTKTVNANFNTKQPVYA